MRVALVGYGTGGSVFHAPMITATEGLELDAVVTNDPERRADVKRRYPQAALFGDPGEIWDDPGDYDLAVITTPNRTHAPLAQAALAAGLHVVVDKPVATTVNDARTIAAFAQEHDRTAIPFHNRRYDGDFLTVRRLLDDGDLGAVHRFESRFERWRPEIKPGWKESADPADGGGIQFDLGAHLIDQAIALFGTPARVYAEMDVRRSGAKAVDDAFIALTFGEPSDDAVRSHLWMSAVAADLGPRFRVLGADAAYVKYGLDPQEQALRDGRTPDEDDWGADSEELYGCLGAGGDTTRVPTEPGRYQRFYADVVACLRDGAPPPATMDDAITGLRAIEAADRSARVGVLVPL
jgi:predicted dehydrogenase